MFYVLRSLYAVNSEFVMPAWVAKLVPHWLNHGFIFLFSFSFNYFPFVF